MTSRLSPSHPTRPGVVDPLVVPTDIGIVHLGWGAFHRAHQAVYTQMAMDISGDSRWGILGDVERTPALVPALREQGGRYTVLAVGPDDRGQEVSQARIIASVVDVAYPGNETGRLLAAMAAPSTHVITLTVTEKGYCRTADGALDLAQVAPDVQAFASRVASSAALEAASPSDEGAGVLPSGADAGTGVPAGADAVVGADAAAGTDADAGTGASAEVDGGHVAPATTAIGLLMRGLLERYLAGRQPVTVLSCDNMAENGRVLRAVCGQFLDAAAQALDLAAPAQTGSADQAEHADLVGTTGLVGGTGQAESTNQPVNSCRAEGIGQLCQVGQAAARLEAFVAWLGASTTWPSSMVDRITPAVTDHTLALIQEAVGAVDLAGVSAEPFMQWVIEDNFAGPRPAWERAGALFVQDVAPWEEAKLRMLNGTHSVIAYAGRVFGYATMDQAVQAPQIADHARTYMFDDALPSVDTPAGADLTAYGQGLLRRFANPATGHTTAQVSTDGSQKIPFRWGSAAKFHLDQGRVPQGIAFGLAAWSEFVRRTVAAGGDLGDPAAAEVLTTTVQTVQAGQSGEAAQTGEAAQPDTVAPLLIAQALIALPGILPAGVGTHPGLIAAVTTYVKEMTQQ